MKTPLLLLPLALAAAVVATTSLGAGAVNWAPAFSDDFATPMSFAELWKPDKDAPVKSADGHAVFSGKAKMTRNGAPFKAFRASATVAVTKGTAGLMCGKEKVAVSAGESKRVTLDCSKGDFSSQPLYVFADGEATVDDILVEVPRSADESPNLVINSGMENAPDGFPTHYSRWKGFDLSSWYLHDYEEYLTMIGADTNVFHSGRTSFRFSAADWNRGESVMIKNVGTKKGAAGVISAWVKADRPGVKFNLSYGKPCRGGTFTATTEWQRYESVCTNLPGARPYFSPASMGLAKDVAEGTLWFDDVQVEILDTMPTAEELASGKIFATPYRPSELDKTRFGGVTFGRATGFAVPKLPTGLKPSVELDGWIGKAAKTDDFWLADRKPTRNTEAFFAVDDEKLYVGVRCYGETFVSRGDRELSHDTGAGLWGARSTSVELHLDPTGLNRRWQFAFNDFGTFDRGEKLNVDWNGDWDHELRANAKAGATDYFFALPLRHFASADLADNWPVLIGRNDGEVGECIGMARQPMVGFHKWQYWPILSFPAEVMAKYRLEKKAEAAANEPKVLGWLNYYMNEPEAKFRVTWPDGRVTEESVDIRKFKNGETKVKVAGVETTVVKRRFWKGATQINRWARCLRKDGRNILMAGPFIADLAFSKHGSADKYDMMSDFWAHEGFRYIHALVPIPRKGAVTELPFQRGEQLMARTKKNGQKVLYWTEFRRPPKAKTPEERAEMVATNKYYASVLQKHENILSFLIMDEPELGSYTSDEARDQLREIRPLFPYHPVQMNNTYLGIPNRFADLETDVLMLDAYLTSDESTKVADVVRQVDEMRKAGAEEGKPCYYFIVMGNFPLHYKEPSYAEQIAQSWGCVCAGCTGISWYTGLPHTPGSWHAIRQMAREFAELEETLVSDELVEEVRASAAVEELRVLTKKRGDERIVAACSIVPEAAKDVTFTVPKSLPQDGTLEVLWENRTVEVRDGVFRDDFPGYTRHVYRFR